MDSPRGRRRGMYDGWHDVHIRVRGPAVRDIEPSFRDRWNDTETPSTLPPVASSPGTHPVQALRTFAGGGNNRTFASAGERTCLEGYRKAIRQAGVCRYARDLRRSLRGEHLNLLPGDRRIADPISGVAEWERQAAAGTFRVRHVPASPQDEQRLRWNHVYDPGGSCPRKPWPRCSKPPAAVPRSAATLSSSSKSLPEPARPSRSSRSPATCSSAAR